MVSANEYLMEVRGQVDAQLDQLLPPGTTAPMRLHEAMRYSVFAGGKRLRPALCIASCEAVGGSRAAALTPAAALEALHTYTLIHDDLPAMDNDDMRRGKPSCHKAFDESTAILAGDGLLTCAFEWVSSTGNAKYGEELGRATGSLGTIGGQEDDMQAKGKAISREEIISIHERKTAMLFAVSCRFGAIAAGATEEQIEALGKWGMSLGVAFQLLDDVCDNDPVTMQTFSREDAIELAREYEDAAVKALEGVSGSTDILAGLAQLLIASFAL